MKLTKNGGPKTKYSKIFIFFKLHIDVNLILVTYIPNYFKLDLTYHPYLLRLVGLKFYKTS